MESYHLFFIFFSLGGVIVIFSCHFVYYVHVLKEFENF